MLKALCLYEYQLPLKPEFSLKNSIRKGLILEDPDREIFSEAAPLPLHSLESHEEASLQLHSLLKEILFISSPEDLLLFLKKHRPYPSVAFAIYALFDQLFSPTHYPCTFPIRHYIDIHYQNLASCDSILEKIRSLNVLSTDTIKIKLGSYPVSVAISLMRSLLCFCDARIQLDINQKWSLEETLQFCRAFEGLAFDCIEDPTQTLRDLFIFTKYSSFPISLDRFLRTHSIKDVLHLPTLKACEFKPTLDIFKILDENFMQILNEHHIQYTFSSSYESSIGINAIGRLGLKKTPLSCLGIDTLGIFSHDILFSPFYNQGNLMIVSEPLKPNRIFLKHLVTTSLSHC